MSDETGLISAEMAAALLMTTPGELAALSRRGVVAAPVTKSPARYRLVELVQGYLKYLQNEPTRPRNQSEAADHIGLTTRQFRNLLEEGVIERTAGAYDLAVVRKQYVAYVTASIEARGRSSDLTAERAALAREQLEAAQHRNALNRADYVPRAELERQLTPLIAHTRERILSIAPKLAGTLAHRKREEVEEILEQEVIATLNELAAPVPFDGGPDRTK